MGPRKKKSSKAPGGNTKNNQNDDVSGAQPDAAEDHATAPPQAPLPISSHPPPAVPSTIGAEPTAALDSADAATHRASMNNAGTARATGASEPPPPAAAATDDASAAAPADGGTAAAAAAPAFKGPDAGTAAAAQDVTAAGATGAVELSFAIAAVADDDTAAAVDQASDPPVTAAAEDDEIAAAGANDTTAFGARDTESQTHPDTAAAAAEDASYPAGPSEADAAAVNLDSASLADDVRLTPAVNTSHTNGVGVTHVAPVTEEPTANLLPSRLETVEAPTLTSSRSAASQSTPRPEPQAPSTEVLAILAPAPPLSTTGDASPSRSTATPTTPPHHPVTNGPIRVSLDDDKDDAEDSQKGKSPPSTAAPVTLQLLPPATCRAAFFIRALAPLQAGAEAKATFYHGARPSPCVGRCFENSPSGGSSGAQPCESPNGKSSTATTRVGSAGGPPPAAAVAGAQQQQQHVSGGGEWIDTADGSAASDAVASRLLHRMGGAHLPFELCLRMDNHCGNWPQALASPNRPPPQPRPAAAARCDEVDTDDPPRGAARHRPSSSSTPPVTQKQLSQPTEYMKRCNEVLLQFSPRTYSDYGNLYITLLQATEPALGLAETSAGVSGAGATATATAFLTGAVSGLFSAATGGAVGSGSAMGLGGAQSSNGMMCLGAEVARPRPLNSLAVGSARAVCAAVLARLGVSVPTTSVGSADAVDVDALPPPLPGGAAVAAGARARKNFAVAASGAAWLLPDPREGLTSDSASSLMAGAVIDSRRLRQRARVFAEMLETALAAAAHGFVACDMTAAAATPTTPGYSPATPANVAHPQVQDMCRFLPRSVDAADAAVSTRAFGLDLSDEELRALVAACFGSDCGAEGTGTRGDVNPRGNGCGGADGGIPPGVAAGDAEDDHGHGMMFPASSDDFSFSPPRSQTPQPATTCDAPEAAGDAATDVVLDQASVRPDRGTATSPPESARTFGPPPESLMSITSDPPASQGIAAPALRGTAAAAAASASALEPSALAAGLPSTSGSSGPGGGSPAASRGGACDVNIASAFTAATATSSSNQSDPRAFLSAATDSPSPGAPHAVGIAALSAPAAAELTRRDHSAADPEGQYMTPSVLPRGGDAAVSSKAPSHLDPANISVPRASSRHRSAQNDDNSNATVNDRRPHDSADSRRSHGACGLPRSPPLPYAEPREALTRLVALARLARLIRRHVSLPGADGDANMGLGAVVDVCDQALARLVADTTGGLPPWVEGKGGATSAGRHPPRAGATPGGLGERRPNRADDDDDGAVSSDEDDEPADSPTSARLGGLRDPASTWWEAATASIAAGAQPRPLGGGGSPHLATHSLPPPPPPHAAAAAAATHTTPVPYVSAVGCMTGNLDVVFMERILNCARKGFPALSQQPEAAAATTANKPGGTSGGRRDNHAITAVDPNAPERPPPGAIDTPEARTLVAFLTGPQTFKVTKLANRAKTAFRGILAMAGSAVEGATAMTSSAAAAVVASAAHHAATANLVVGGRGRNVAGPANGAAARQEVQNVDSCDFPSDSDGDAQPSAAARQQSALLGGLEDDGDAALEMDDNIFMAVLSSTVADSATSVPHRSTGSPRPATAAAATRPTTVHRPQASPRAAPRGPSATKKMSDDHEDNDDQSGDDDTDSGYLNVPAVLRHLSAEYPHEPTRMLLDFLTHHLVVDAQKGAWAAGAGSRSQRAGEMRAFAHLQRLVAAVALMHDAGRWFDAVARDADAALDALAAEEAAENQAAVAAALSYLRLSIVRDGDPIRSTSSGPQEAPRTAPQNVGPAPASAASSAAAPVVEIGLAAPPDPRYVSRAFPQSAVEEAKASLALVTTTADALAELTADVDRAPSTTTTTTSTTGAGPSGVPAAVPSRFDVDATTVRLVLTRALREDMFVLLHLLRAIARGAAASLAAVAAHHRGVVDSICAEARHRATDAAKYWAAEAARQKMTGAVVSATLGATSAKPPLFGFFSRGGGRTPAVSPAPSGPAPPFCTHQPTTSHQAAAGGARSTAATAAAVCCGCFLDASRVEAAVVSVLLCVPALHRAYARTTRLAALCGAGAAVVDGTQTQHADALRKQKKLRHGGAVGPSTTATATAGGDTPSSASTASPASTIGSQLAQATARVQQLAAREAAVSAAQAAGYPAPEFAEHR